MTEVKDESGKMSTAPAKPVEKMTKSEEGAMRANGAKIRMHLVPSEFMIELAGIFHTGAAKYAPHNWTKGLNPDELLDSILRHYVCLRSGELKDADTHCLHSSLIAWNALALSTFLMRDPSYIAKFLNSLGGPNLSATAQLEYEAKRHAEVAEKNNNWDHLHGRDKVSESSD